MLFKKNHLDFGQLARSEAFSLYSKELTGFLEDFISFKHHTETDNHERNPFLANYSTKLIKTSENENFTEKEYRLDKNIQRFTYKKSKKHTNNAPVEIIYVDGSIFNEFTFKVNSDISLWTPLSFDLIDRKNGELIYGKQFKVKLNPIKNDTVEHNHNIWRRKNNILTPKTSLGQGFLFEKISSGLWRNPGISQVYIAIPDNGNKNQYLQMTVINKPSLTREEFRENIKKQHLASGKQVTISIQEETLVISFVSPEIIKETNDLFSILFESKQLGGMSSDYNEAKNILTKMENQFFESYKILDSNELELYTLANIYKIEYRIDQYIISSVSFNGNFI